MDWVRAWWDELTLPLRAVARLPGWFGRLRHDPVQQLRALGLLSATGLAAIGMAWAPWKPPPFQPPPPRTVAVPAPPPVRPARPERPPLRAPPDSIPPDTVYPPVREGVASGSIRLDSFNPDLDIIWVDDPRVWFSSDHRPTAPPPVDHHLMHRAMEGPFRNLVDLVEAAGGRLRVHAAYRREGVHSRYSLHKEGRALDLSADHLSLEEVAKLAYQAGFDWVYHEATSKGGAHVHASVRRWDDDAP